MTKKIGRLTDKIKHPKRSPRTGCAFEVFLNSSERGTDPNMITRVFVDTGCNSANTYCELESPTGSFKAPLSSLFLQWLNFDTQRK